MTENKTLEALCNQATAIQLMIKTLIDLELDHARALDELATQAGDEAVSGADAEDSKRAIVETMRESAKNIRQRHSTFLHSGKELAKQIDETLQRNTSILFESEDWAKASPQQREKLIQVMLTTAAANIACATVLERGE